jgi:Fibronectin type III domain
MDLHRPECAPRRDGATLVFALLVFMVTAPTVAAAEATTTLPAAPTNLTAIPISGQHVILDWHDNSDDETQFRIERKTLEGDFLDVIGTLDPHGLIENLTPDTIYIFRVRARNDAGDSAYSNEVAVSTLTRVRQCRTAGQNLCVQNRRHLVRVYWQTPDGRQGRGNAVQATPDTGYFWFFDPDNVEMVVKVLDGCTLNNAYWVFAGGVDQRAGDPGQYSPPVIQLYQCDASSTRSSEE